jgi:hypothetical protein
MSNTATSTFPYTLEIEPPKSPGGSYQWAIRKNGKLAQRSDRNYPTEAKARENGLAQIEKLLSGLTTDDTAAETGRAETAQPTGAGSYQQPGK